MVMYMVFVVKFICVWVYNENGFKVRIGINLCGVFVK